MSPTPDRRAALIRLTAFAAFVGLAGGRGALASPAGRELVRWVDRVDQISAALRGETVGIADWREGVAEILDQASLKDVMRDIDFSRLAGRAGFADLGVATARIDFGPETRCLAFIGKIFAIGKGRSIIPHGHANMVSAHLPLSGRLRLRQYDQLERQDDALTVRQTEDRTIGPGDLSSIGDPHDNVHWFIAEEPSYTFDVIVTGLDRKADRPHEIFNIDIEEARPLSDGRLRAPILPVAAALKKYG